MKQVLCITLNPAIDMTVAVDGLKIGEVNRATATQVDAAGKALNSAQVLADLGVESFASGFLGQDNEAIYQKLFADKSAKHLALHDAFVRVTGETRTNVKIVDHGTTTDVNGKGFVVSESDKASLLTQVVDLAAKVDAVLVAGSLPQGYDVADFEALLDALLAVNAKVAADVSGSALKVALTKPLWMIKPNNDELAEVFGVPCDTLADQQAVFAQSGTRIEHIVISMGAQGVHWLNGNIAYQGKPPLMNVQSTVGAGDTLVAGMMHGLIHEASAQETLTRAIALSAHAVSIVGFGIPDKDKLNTLSEQVQISTIQL